MFAGVGADAWVPSAGCGGRVAGELTSREALDASWPSVVGGRLEVGRMSWLSWTVVNSWDCLPLTGVTGSLGDSLSDSVVSSRIAQLMSVRY